MNIIAPSLLSADFSQLGEEIDRIQKAGAQWLHYDVMDGIFVPNISFGQPVLKSLKKKTDIFMDVHLMIDEPHRYVKEYVACGADMITFHTEAETDVTATLNAIHEAGAGAGIAIKPKTSFEEIIEYLPMCDMLLVMTVEPGFGGQSFMQDMMHKVTAAREYISTKDIKCRIEVDGGINDSTIGIAARAGADTFVAGSYVFGAKDVSYAVKSLFDGSKQSY